MNLLKKILLEEEDLRYRTSYGSITIALSDRAIFIYQGNNITIISPAHVYTITVTRDLGLVIAGFLFLFLGFLLKLINLENYLNLGYLNYYQKISIIFIVIIIGIILILYGILTRYRLNIIFANGNINLKGGDKIIKTAKEIRKIAGI